MSFYIAQVVLCITEHPVIFICLFSSTEIIVFYYGQGIYWRAISGTVFAATNMIITLGGVVLQPLVGKLLDAFGIAVQPVVSIFTP